MKADTLDILSGWIEEAGPDDPPPVIGVAGAQGSGKTTLARRAAQAFGAVQLSLDDVYLTRAERARLAEDVHPLMAVRGPPGTHGLGLLAQTLDALRGAGPNDLTPLPAFDKVADERLPSADWPVFRGRPRAILIDGWCLGATAQAQVDLLVPINALERDHDPDGDWRRAVNAALAGPYQTAFARMDRLLYLAAPDFGVVEGWRLEQEAELLGLSDADALPPERTEAVRAFVRHFERVTRHMLAGGVRADATALLDAGRRTTGWRASSRS